jgi:4'-phosphopantetheinyl transferase
VPGEAPQPRVVVALVAVGSAPDPREAAALTAAERRHADGLRDVVAAPFVAARALLRRTLAEVAGVPLATVRLGVDPHGKLAPAGPLSGWHCNVSHTDGLAAVAVARGVRVGVDVERVADDGDRRGRRVLPSVLAPGEATTVDGAADADRLPTFLAIWTRKEAFLKGVGCGLTVEPRLVDVGPSGPRIRAAPHELEPERWCLHDLAAGPSHAGALAVAAPDAVVDRRPAPPVPGRGRGLPPGGAT